MKLSIFSMNRTGNETEPAGGENPKDILTGLRQRILNRLLVVLTAFGTVVLLIDLPFLINNHNWPTIGSAAIVLIALFLATINRQLAYRLRAGVVLGGLAVVGLSTLVSEGMAGSGRVFLVTVSFLAAMLTGLRGRIGWLVISLALLVVTAAGMLLGWIPAAAPIPSSGSASLIPWLVALVGFVFAAGVGTTSLGMLLEGMQTSLTRQQELTGELEAERGRLVQRVADRTQDLERRLVQIRTAAEISAAIGRGAAVETTAIDQLLIQVSELIRERFNLYYVGIFLIEAGRAGDPSARYAVLRAGTGEAGQEMLAAGHRLQVGGDSMIGWACENKQPKIALDVGVEAVRFNNPHLPLTRSELALPILSGQAGDPSTELRMPAGFRSPAASKAPETGRVRALGALTIQSAQESAFDQDDITALQGIADSLASAIENNNLFTAMQASLNEIQALHRQYLEEAWGRAAAKGDLSYEYGKKPAQTEPEADHLAANRPGSTAARPQVLEIPIRVRDQIIGNLLLEGDPESTSGSWTAEELALAEEVAEQAAIALENARLLEETQRSAEAERKATQITQKLWATSDIESIVRITLSELGTWFEARQGWVELWPSPPGRSRVERGSALHQPLEDSDARA